jgi:tubulin polyglutamylase TTLL4
MAGFHYIASGN